MQSRPLTTWARRRKKLGWSASCTSTAHGAAELVAASVEGTLPEEHWRRVRTKNPLERIVREMRRHTRVVGSFPDGLVVNLTPSGALLQ